MIKMAAALVTHWGQDKTVAVFQTTFSIECFLYENCPILIKIPLKDVPRGPIKDKSVLLQILSGRRTGDMRLSAPMFT